MTVLHPHGDVGITVGAFHAFHRTLTLALLAGAVPLRRHRACLVLVPERAQQPERWRELRLRRRLLHIIEQVGNDARVGQPGVLRIAARTGGESFPCRRDGEHRVSVLCCDDAPAHAAHARGDTAGLRDIREVLGVVEIEIDTRHEALAAY